MIQFLKDAIREFRHVVWSTRKETQKFFTLVLAMLVFFGVYLFVASNIFSEIIFGLKNILGPESTTSVSSSMSQDEIDALFSQEVHIDGDHDDTMSGSALEVSEESTATGEVAQ